MSLSNPKCLFLFPSAVDGRASETDAAERGHQDSRVFPPYGFFLILFIYIHSKEIVSLLDLTPPHICILIPPWTGVPLKSTVERGHQDTRVPGLSLGYYMYIFTTKNTSHPKCMFLLQWTGVPLKRMLQSEATKILECFPLTDSS